MVNSKSNKIFLPCFRIALKKTYFVEIIKSLINLFLVVANNNFNFRRNHSWHKYSFFH